MNGARSRKYSIVAHEWTPVAADSLRQLAGMVLGLQWRMRRCGHVVVSACKFSVYHLGMTEE
jgi:hypothetical protein